ncbi:MBL fold metallo-hydrolase [Cryobacterium sp. TMS1-20-1]|uniref:MBL fold metallo-hydrolase n=1 Tax=Cryobacterium sp. TMS1-20-1 TaxID=1259223 RepID=UPI00141AB9F7|nr:MBL fold metallo-hydrolase [Cryobacterium sp. TMS1-20-1]
MDISGAVAFAPEEGELRRLADGVYWSRLPLPYAPFHVNCYVLDDEDGWLIVEAGIDSPDTRRVWQMLLDGPLASKPVNRLVVTHWHSDHVGLAGWLVAETGAALIMSDQEFSRAWKHCALGRTERRAQESEHLRRHGADVRQLAPWLDAGFDYLSHMSPLPSAYESPAAGTAFRIGSDTFRVVHLGGHSPAALGLYSPSSHIFICGDQIAPEFVPSVGQLSDSAGQDVLSDYLSSVLSIRDALPADTLVLPGHQEPNMNLHESIDRIVAYHRKVDGRILETARDAPISAAELVPLMSRKAADDVWLGFTISRAIAYATRLTTHEHRAPDRRGRWRCRALPHRRALMTNSERNTMPDSPDDPRFQLVAPESADSIRALVCEELGPPSNLSLRTIARHTLTPSSVRIRVHAAGINFPDVLVIAGTYQVKRPLPLVPGSECAGVVVEVGAEVDSVQVGDRVLAVPLVGCFSEEVVVNAIDVFRIPDALSFASAASFPIIYGTSGHALLDRGRLREGDTVLVNGAGGGIGLAAVEIAYAAGATVIASASSAEKREVALRHGASYTIDHTSENVSSRVAELTNGRGVDVVVDPVGGDAFDSGLRSLAGVVVSW